MSKCNKCNVKLSDDSSDVCPDCKRKGRTKVYFYTGIILLIVGFVGGIIVGVTNKTIVEPNSILDDPKKVFNVMLMFECWATASLLSTIPFGLNSICYRLDLLIDKAKEQK